MTTCDFCGFVSRHGNFVTLPDSRIRCKSHNACTGRLRSGKHLKRRVHLELEIDSPRDDATLQALANIAEAGRIAREIRRALYIHGLCTSCGVKLQSPGRPRCTPCHISRR